MGGYRKVWEDIGIDGRILEGMGEYRNGWEDIETDGRI